MSLMQATSDRQTDKHTYIQTPLITLPSTTAGVSNKNNTAEKNSRNYGKLRD